MIKYLHLKGNLTYMKPWHQIKTLTQKICVDNGGRGRGPSLIIVAGGEDGNRDVIASEEIIIAAVIVV